jgi:ribosomal protein L7Ae-like RNA K-turn-binding protein
VATVAGGDLPPTQRQLREYRAGAESLRIGNYLGLAMKAGLVAAGDMAAEKALKTRGAHLLVLARDISPAVALELTSLARNHRIALLWWPDKETLGLTVGKSRRGALVLLDKGFSEAIIRICEENL